MAVITHMQRKPSALEAAAVPSGATQGVESCAMRAANKQASVLAVAYAPYSRATFSGRTTVYT